MNIINIMPSAKLRMHCLYKKASYIAFYKISKLSPKPSSKSIMHTGKAICLHRGLPDPPAVTHLRGKIFVLNSPSEHRQLKKASGPGKTASYLKLFLLCLVESWRLCSVYTWRYSQLTSFHWSAIPQEAASRQCNSHVSLK